MRKREAEKGEKGGQENKDTNNNKKKSGVNRLKPSASVKNHLCSKRIQKMGQK